MALPSWAANYSGYGEPSDNFVYNTTGDARAVAKSPVGAFGNAITTDEDGNPIAKTADFSQNFQVFDPSSNSWNELSAPHYEERSYQWTGLNAPEYNQAFLDKISGQADAYDSARLQTPGALGQAIDRPDLSEFSPMGGDQNQRELTFLMQSGGLNGIQMTPQQIDSAWAQINSSTPAAQAARDTDDGFGDIMQLAMMAGAIYLGGAAMGAWGGGGAAAGATGAAGAGALGTAGAWAPLAGAAEFATPGFIESAMIAGSEAGALGLTAAESAALSAGTSATAGYVGGALTPDNLLSSGIRSAGQEAISSAVSGRDFSPGNVATGIISNTAGGATSAGVRDALGGELPSPITNALSSGAGGGVRAAISGGDVGNAIVGNAVGSGVASGVNQAIGGQFQSVANAAGRAAGEVATGRNIGDALASGAGTLSGNAAGNAVNEIASSAGIEKGLFTYLAGSLVGAIVSGGVTGALTGSPADRDQSNPAIQPDGRTGNRYMGTPEFAGLTDRNATQSSGGLIGFTSRAVKRANERKA